MVPRISGDHEIALHITQNNTRGEGDTSTHPSHDPLTLINTRPHKNVYAKHKHVVEKEKEKESMTERERSIPS